MAGAPSLALLALELRAWPEFALCLATWPLLLWVQKRVGGRRSIATAVMTIVMLIIFVVPFWAAIGALLDASAKGIDVVRAYLAHGLGSPPAWIAGIPWVGDRIAGEWCGRLMTKVQ